MLNSNWNGNRLNVNFNDLGNNENSYAFEMALAPKIIAMKTHKNLVFFGLLWLKGVIHS